MHSFFLSDFPQLKLFLERVISKQIKSVYISVYYEVLKTIKILYCIVFVKKIHIHLFKLKHINLFEVQPLQPWELQHQTARLVADEFFDQVIIGW